MALSAIAELGQRWDVPHPGFDLERARSLLYEARPRRFRRSNINFSRSTPPEWGFGQMKGFSRCDRVR